MIIELKHAEIQHLGMNLIYSKIYVLFFPKLSFPKFLSIILNLFPHHLLFLYIYNDNNVIILENRMLPVQTLILFMVSTTVFSFTIIIVLVIL